MKKILISFDKVIEYDESMVKINSKQITELDDLDPEQYAKHAMRDYYRGILSSHFENFIILTGSGSSVDIGVENKGQTMKGLWKCVIQ